jgi:hypothetical protein
MRYQLAAAIGMTIAMRTTSSVSVQVIPQFSVLPFKLSSTPVFK